jgi:hypothetical protein
MSLGEDILSGLTGDTRRMAESLMPMYVRLLEYKMILGAMGPVDDGYESALGDFNVQAQLIKAKWQEKFGDSVADVANAALRWVIGLVL